MQTMIKIKDSQAKRIMLFLEILAKEIDNKIASEMIKKDSDYLRRQLTINEIKKFLTQKESKMILRSGKEALKKQDRIDKEFEKHIKERFKAMKILKKRKKK